MLKEFKNFIMTGNVVEFAVAVIMAGAIGAVVIGFVGDIIMPIVGVLIGGYDFSKLSYKIGEAEIKYGNFIQTSFNFLIIAFVLFMVIKAINNLKRLEELKLKK